MCSSRRFSGKLPGPCQEGCFLRESTLCIKVEIQILFPPLLAFICEALDVPQSIFVCRVPPTCPNIRGAGAQGKLWRSRTALNFSLLLFSPLVKLLLGRQGAGIPLQPSCAGGAFNPCTVPEIPHSCKLSPLRDSPAVSRLL